VEKVITRPEYPCPAAWLHDGNTVLAWPRSDTGKPIRLELNTGKSQFIDIPLSTEAVALSSDDKTAYLTIHDEKSKNTSIVSVDLATLEQKRVWNAPFASETDSFVDRKLALSPDGRTLAMVVWDTKTAHLIRVATDGTRYQVLYSSPKPRSDSGKPEISPGALSWTRDGRALLFGERETDQLRVMRISSDGGKPEFSGLAISQATAPGTGWHIISDLEVTPDGRQIFFYSPRNPNISAATGSTR
jgi:Tol biopolymer transport system component